MSSSDYLAKFRQEAEIAGYAAKLRNLAGLRFRLPIDVISAATFLTTRSLPRKGQLDIIKSVHSENQAPAYVTFEPLILHVDIDLWTMATHEHAYCRFVLAHELGHILLHENGMQPFSGKMRDFTAKGFQEQSAEWQANVFAYYFLAPDELAKLAWGADDLAAQASMPVDKAQEVLASLNRRKIWSKPELLGESCFSCQNFSLTQNQIFRKCTTCGAQTFF